MPQDDFETLSKCTLTVNASDSLGDEDTELGLGGKGSPARCRTSKKESGEVLNVSLKIIDEAFATVFAFE